MLTKFEVVLPNPAGPEQEVEVIAHPKAPTQDLLPLILFFFEGLQLTDKKDKEKRYGEVFVVRHDSSKDHIISIIQKLKTKFKIGDVDAIQKPKEKEEGASQEESGINQDNEQGEDPDKESGRASPPEP